MPAVVKCHRIGLMGGSFNPAHEGHRRLSLCALERLGLDEVWWLVSPQNPLKPEAGMARLADRLHRAREVADHPLIRPTSIESRLGTRYTVDSLKAIRESFPDFCFVWLMGADNLKEMPRWHDWRRIFRSVPIAIFARPPYSFRAMLGRAARRFARHRLPESRARRLAGSRPPSWVFVHMPPSGVSATRIRAAELEEGSGR